MLPFKCFILMFAGGWWLLMSELFESQQFLLLVRVIIKTFYTYLQDIV